MKKVYLLLADGFEVVEALASLDVMTRGGIDICTVAVDTGLRVSASHGLASVEADRLLGDSLLEDGDAVILPGGYPGYVNLGRSEVVGRVVKSYYAAGKIVAAICAAPSVLALNHVAEGSKIACHSCVCEQMSKAYRVQRNGVVRDGNLITAPGAGWSIDFALAVALAVADRSTVDKIKQGMEIK